MNIVFITDLGHATPKVPMLAHELGKNANINVSVFCPKLNTFQRNQFLPFESLNYSLVEFKNLRSNYKRFDYLPKNLAKAFRLFLKLLTFVTSKVHGVTPILGENRLLERKWESNVKRALLSRGLLTRDTVLISSSSPFISHVTSSRIADEHGLIWIADYRDPWSTNHVRAKERLDEALIFEASVLTSASGVTASSNQLISDLDSIYSGPKIIVHNGFISLDDDPSQRLSDNSLNIIYIGQTYPEFQNLFSFLRDLEQINRGQTKARVTFVGRSCEQVRDFYANSNLPFPQYISTRHEVPVSQVPHFLREADVLLFFTWNKELRRTKKFKATVIGSKIYDYLGARRFIVAYGPNCDGAIDELLVATGVGLRTENLQDSFETIKNRSSVASILESENLKTIMEYSFHSQSKLLLDFIVGLKANRLL